MIDLAELERLADAATPGPWQSRGGTAVVAARDLVARGLWLADARFIAAADPSTVKALIARIRELARTIGDAQSTVETLDVDRLARAIRVVLGASFAPEADYMPAAHKVAREYAALDR